MSDASAAKVFDALGDPTRRMIVEELRSGPLPVGALAGRLPVRRPAVSKHLHVLEGAGLVEHESVGTRNLYALAPEGLVAAQRWLVEAWDEVLNAFSDHTTRLVAQPSSPAQPGSPVRNRRHPPKEVTANERPSADPA
jgi:DNA-binding transcriptional ArsR family regulator